MKFRNEGRRPDRVGQISQSPSREVEVKLAGDRDQEASGAVQEGVEPLGRARVLGGRPVVYVARLERVADHGPGRLLTLEAKPERERAVGVVGNVPDLVLATAEQWALSLDGEAPERVRGRWLGVIRRWLRSWPWLLEPGRLVSYCAEPAEGLVVQGGDTLVCGCAGPCHRGWVAELLVEAGWEVVLDGELVRCEAA